MCCFPLLPAQAIGAIAGILFAPDKGSVTREKLRDKAKDFSDNFNEKYENLKDELKHLKDKMKTNRKDRVEVTPE